MTNEGLSPSGRVGQASNVDEFDFKWIEESDSSCEIAFRNGRHITSVVRNRKRIIDRIMFQQEG